MKTFVIVCALLGSIGALDAEAGCGMRSSGSCGGRAKLFEGRARGGISCGKTRVSACESTPRASSCSACDKANIKAAPATAPMTDKK